MAWASVSQPMGRDPLLGPEGRLVGREVGLENLFTNLFTYLNLLS